MNALRSILAALVLAFAAAIPARAMSVLPLDLDALIDQAATAFHGRVVENRTERDPATGLVVTYTKFVVDDVLKGKAERVHEIKQIGGALPGEAITYRVSGIPSFAVGEECVVFLAGVSAAGFSSPVGLGQGRFSVSGPESARRASNGRENLELGELMQVVRARVQATAR